MSDNEFLKSIGELECHHFCIPDYQRGYRWTKEQVNLLLDDLNDFFENHKDDKEAYYLLQPVIVKKRNKNDYEVVDGQQRLTTLFLILKYLENKNKNENGKNNCLYSIKYATREKSKEFLEELVGSKENNDHKNDAKCKKYIDYFRMCEVWEAIQDWFNNNKCNKIDKEKFKEKLLGKVKVIWYELGEEENPEEVFIRINIGKIPLTSAELIRAFLLKKIKDAYQDDHELAQINFALQWDEMAARIREDDFWYFLFNAHIPVYKRLDEFFALIAEINNTKPNENNKQAKFNKHKYKTFPYHLFDFFYLLWKNKSWIEIEKEWNKIKNYFNKLLDWYYDKDMYHLVGFSKWKVWKNDELKDLLLQNTSKSKMKNELKTNVYRKIWELIKKKNSDEENINFDEWINNLNYYQPNEVKFILFLHNLIKYHNHPENLRFPFDKFKNVKTWSIEHIFAQNIEDIKENIHIEELKNLLKEVRTIIKSAVEGENNNECPINEDCTDENKTKCIEELKCLLEQIEDIHNIKNLAVIPLRLNSELNNKVFKEKRSIIIDRFFNPELPERFVPLATYMVFNKTFSDNAESLQYWFPDKDGENYVEDIKTSIKNFLISKSK